MATVGRFVLSVGTGAALSALLVWFFVLWNLTLWRLLAVAFVLNVVGVLVVLRLRRRYSREPVGRAIRFRTSLTVVIAFLGMLIGRPAAHLLWTAWNDRDDRTPTPEGYVDDASRMNQTRVREVWDVPADAEQAEQQLAELLHRARRDGLKVSIAGSRHSMGGHTITPDGIAINMLPFNRMELDEKSNILRVGSGARWSEIIPYLDKRGRSVAVMQSNNSFSVGGSISVNCHGWQIGSPPIASTVESLRLMKADGNIVPCSRNENRELFSLVLGGYGLFGIILDVDLRVVANERYRSKQFVIPADASLETFDRKVREDADARMVYARLNISPDRLFRDVVLNVYYRDPDGEIPPLKKGGMTGLRRSVFRGSAGSEYGKRFRWFAETQLQPLLARTAVSRNQLLNESVTVFQDRSDETVDILHEYFVPRGQIAEFVEDVRRIVPAHKGDLLNVTVRSVNTDADTFLRYADQHVFALVMLFSQKRTAQGETKMQAMTRDLIDAALKRSGRYYLPYRLHATPEQFRRAYPQARRFFELKRQYDPHEIFQSKFYLKYGRA